MSRLSQEQQQLILDFYFRCGENSDIEAGRDLIASNPEAAQLYAGLEESLSVLDPIKYEPCPDNLVDLTLARLKLAALAGQQTQPVVQDINQLLRQHQSRLEPTEAGNHRLTRSKFRPIVETFAAAAAVLIVAGMLFPSFGSMRQHSRQLACSRNLGQVGNAFASFVGDQNAAAAAEMKIKNGSPWWKVGYEGPETQSNTRYVWQLVRQGYVPADVFVCKGRKGAVPVRMTGERMARLQDFPARPNVSYSFVIFSEGTFSPARNGRTILAGDLNPVFEKIPCQQSIYQKLNEFEKVMLNDQLRQMMSGNHACRGQNLLYTDGSVEFLKTRIVNGDDIFTVNGVDSYTGREIPANERDTFLAP
jgi:hypothetical protein